MERKDVADFLDILHNVLKEGRYVILLIQNEMFNEWFKCFCNAGFEVMNRPFVITHDLGKNVTRNYFRRLELSSLLLQGIRRSMMGNLLKGLFNRFNPQVVNVWPAWPICLYRHQNILSSRARYRSMSMKIRCNFLWNLSISLLRGVV